MKGTIGLSRAGGIYRLEKVLRYLVAVILRYLDSEMGRLRDAGDALNVFDFVLS